MEPITDENVIPLLEAVVRGREDFVYKYHPGADICLYVWKGKPDCLIGHVLVNQGKPVEELKYDGKGLSTGIGCQWANDLPISPNARRVLAVVQSEQDVGRPWGEALAEGRKFALELGLPV